MDTFRLAPTPAHFTDAEISGLFRMLEQERSDDGRAALPAPSPIEQAPPAEIVP